MEADVLFLLYLAVRQSTFLPTISVLDREGSTGPWQGDIHDTARHGSPPPPPIIIISLVFLIFYFFR